MPLLHQRRRAAREEVKMKSKSDIIAEVAETTGQSKVLVEKIVSATFKSLVDTAIAGDETRIAGFGTFKVKASDARVGRNPSTGGSVDIPASKKLGFKMASDLKGKI